MELISERRRSGTLCRRAWVLASGAGAARFIWDIARTTSLPEPSDHLSTRDV